MVARSPNHRLVAWGAVRSATFLEFNADLRRSGIWYGEAGVTFSVSLGLEDRSWMRAQTEDSNLMRTDWETAALCCRSPLAEGLPLPGQGPVPLGYDIFSSLYAIDISSLQSPNYSRVSPASTALRAAMTTRSHRDVSASSSKKTQVLLLQGDFRTEKLSYDRNEIDWDETKGHR
jgi:hypothetical protein